MQDFVSQYVSEDEITITFKDEGGLSLDDLTQFLYLFETLYIATGNSIHIKSSPLKEQFLQNRLNIAKVEQEDVTVTYEPRYGGFRLEPFECKETDIQTFAAIFSNTESILLKPIDTDLVHRLSHSEKDMWIEIALNIRKDIEHSPFLLQRLDIARLTYTSPPKITFRNITFMLAATICLSGGKINLATGEAEVNGISNAIVNLKNALVGEEALVQTSRNCVNRRSEMKDRVSVLAESLTKTNHIGLRNNNDEQL